MKKFYFTIILMSIFLLMSSTLIFASNTTLNINGANSVTLGTTNKITVQISSDSNIGGVMGLIQKTSNITSIKLTAKNGWNIMSFNEETGDFNMVKNEGGKNEDIMEIEYTVSNTEGTGKIEIKDVTVSDVENYDEKEVEDVSKNISIVKKQEDKEDDSKTDTDTEDETKTDTDTDKEDTGKKENSTENNNTTNEEASIDVNKQGTIKNNNQNSNQVKAKTETSTVGKTIPYTGDMRTIIVLAILLVGIISIGTYLGYKKYKGIR